MKKQYILLLAAAGLLTFGQTALRAQNSGTAGGTMDAHIIAPITLTWEHPLNFGVFTTPTGPVVLEEDAPATPITALNVNNINQAPTFVSGAGNTALTNTAQFSAGANGNPGPSIWYVTGMLNAFYSITLPASSITVTGQNFGKTMTVDLFQAYIGGSPVLGGQLTSGLGYQYFAVGGRLHADATDVPDSYVGNFTVQVTYN